MQKCIIPLNEEELYFYEKILKETNGTDYSVEDIVYDVAERVGKNPLVYGIHNPKILLLDEVYHAIWICNSLANQLD